MDTQLTVPSEGLNAEVMYMYMYWQDYSLPSLLVATACILLNSNGEAKVRFLTTGHCVQLGVYNNMAISQNWHW